MEKSAGRVNPPKTKIFSSRMQARLLLVFCVVALFMSALIARLIYIMQVDGERYAKQVLSRQSYVSAILPYKRGEILDRKGTVLARSELQYRLILDAKLLLQYKDSVTPTLTALNKYFGIDIESTRTLLSERAESHYIVLQKNLNYEDVDKFKKAVEQINKNSKSQEKILGVWFEEEYVRSYPYATIACDVIGFSSADNVGYYGIEEYYNDELNGINGREYGYYDAELNIERIVKKAVNGNSVVSTIDINAQRIIQKYIRQFNEEFGSKNIGVLVMDPNSGEILAMASNQEYDLNDPRNLSPFYSEEELAVMTDEQKMTALNSIWKNDAISIIYEPGSTFKPITVATALEESLANDNSTYLCDGKEIIPGLEKPIHCNKRSGHGHITLAQSIMLSCNDAMMQIAALEGREIFYNYEKSFGFGQKTGIDLPGEQSGLIIAKDKLNASELATSSFGQSVTVTMLQLTAAYSSIVNGGYYYQPHIVKEIINENGATVKKIDKLLVRQTVSEATSELLQKYLYLTVEEGTAKHAKVSGYSIGGKTGTAQKLPRDAKTYIVSFIGHVPAINPEVVIYVMIDEPQNVERQDNSSIATTLASRIMAELLPALGIYPEGDIDYLLDDEAGQGNQTGGSNTQSPNAAGNAGNDSGSTSTDSSSSGSTNSGSGNTTNSTGTGNTSDRDASAGNTGTNPQGTDSTAGNNAGSQDANAGDAEQDGSPIADDGQDGAGVSEGINDGNDQSDGDLFIDDEFNPDALE
ncbi:MAG: penicillin-binding protein 2 [Clostridiales bacterium]|nr:penicillin-binding protein 2 [Clostridiales bacterium]